MSGWIHKLDHFSVKNQSNTSSMLDSYQITFQLRIDQIMSGWIHELDHFSTENQRNNEH